MTQSAAQAAAFYREVAVSEKVWTIRDAGGTPTPTNSDGQRAMPFWSSVSRVRSFLAKAPAYASFQPMEIPWSEFATRWTAGLERDGLRAGLNWSGTRATGYDVVPADVLQNVASAKERGSSAKRVKKREPRTRLLDHVEAILGKAESGSVITEGTHDEKYFVTHFSGTPAAGATTFMTLGLSEHRLSQPEGTVRQEFLFAHYDCFKQMHLESAKLVAGVALDCLANHKALLRGEVVGPAGPLGPDTEMQALYCAAPVYFPDELAVFEEPGYEPTVFVWLVPIWDREARFVRAHGHERFEELLVARDPDLLDLSRAALV